MAIESLEWNRGRLSISSLGAMLWPVVFRLEDGREVSPLHHAPWLDDAIFDDSQRDHSNMPDDAPPLLRELRGEWPCVPFGAASADGLQNGWGIPGDAAPLHPHGLPANSDWELERISDTELVARFDTSSVSDSVCRTAGADDQEIAAAPFNGQIERRIRVMPGIARVDLSLKITSSADVSLPIGLHPVFCLPTEPGSAALKVDRYSGVWSHPGDTGGARRVAADVRCPRLEQLPSVLGGQLDATSLPFEGDSEDLLLLTDCAGRASVCNREEGFCTTLAWNATDLPHLMLWISNRGRRDPPWNGRHLALGVEPVCAAFDLGVASSRSANPLANTGHPTAVPLHAGIPWQTEYSLSAVVDADQ